MPRKNRILREKKVRGNRHLYVSWQLNQETSEHKEQSDWLERFWRRVSLLPTAKRELFRLVKRTPLPADAEPGLVQREAFDPVTEDITDVVGVLTETYIVSNTTSGDGELARLFDKAFAATRAASVTARDAETPIQFFLAPLDNPSFFWNVLVRDVSLSDPRLIRIREARFTWPSEAAGKVQDEIAAAVDLIIEGSQD